MSVGYITRFRSKSEKNMLFPVSRQTFAILFHDTRQWSSYFFPFKTLLDISPFGLLNTAHVQECAQKLIHVVLSSYKQLDLPSGIGINKVDVFQSSTRILDPGILIRISMIFSRSTLRLSARNSHPWGRDPVFPFASWYLVLLVFSSYHLVVFTMGRG